MREINGKLFVDRITQVLSLGVGGQQCFISVQYLLLETTAPLPDVFLNDVCAEVLFFCFVFIFCAYRKN